jgi:hypothetical protein
MPHKIKGGKAVCALAEGHAGECEPRDPDTFPGFADEDKDEDKDEPQGKDKGEPDGGVKAKAPSK